MTVRIDTLDNQLAGTRRFLELVGEQLHDLHHLAYVRHTAPEQAKVSGGERDYALDTHGDPAARDAYRGLGEALDATLADLATALHAAAATLRKGGTQGRSGARRLTEAEHCNLLVEQAKRIARGEGTYRYFPQPGAEQALLLMTEKAKRAEKRADRLQRRLDRLTVKGAI